MQGNNVNETSFEICSFYREIRGFMVEWDSCKRNVDTMKQYRCSNR